MGKRSKIKGCRFASVDDVTATTKHVLTLLVVSSQKCHAYGSMLIQRMLGDTTFNASTCVVEGSTHFDSSSG